MFTEQQETLRAHDGIKIARTFTQSAFIYKGDSKQREDNPAYHPPICQREDGKFCDVEGRLLPLSEVPSYIKDAGNPPKAAAPLSQRKMSLAEAMQEADQSNKTADRAPARRTRARATK